MDHYDPQKTARVWQRVQGSAQPPREQADLSGFIAREQADAATYLMLSKKLSGRYSAALRRMHEQERAHAACLKGICTLCGEQRADVPPSPPPREPVEITLRRCHGQEMQCLAQYEARSTDPQHGHIFSRLAQQEREHCRILLEILGSLKPKR